MNRALPLGQQKVLKFLEQRYTARMPMPTLREIAKELGFESTRGAADHLTALERKGFIIRERGKARSIQLVHPPQTTATETYPIPLFGSIPAGNPDERWEGNEGSVLVSSNCLGYKPRNTTYGLRVTGDSMDGKHILDGDIVIVEYGIEPKSGDVVAALIDQESTLKTFVRDKGKSWLQAENPAYPNLIPVDELVVQGVARAVIRRLS